MKEEERKIDCGKYSECLDKVAKKNTRFNCAGCAEYEEPPQTRVDEFEEGLRHSRPQQGDEAVYRCTKCGQMKMKEAFVCTSDARYKFGFKQPCKKCHAESVRAKYREERPGAKSHNSKWNRKQNQTDQSEQADRTAKKTKREKGAKAEPKQDLVRYEPTEAGMELVRVQRTITILIAAGAVTEEKVKQAYEIAGWK